MLFAAAEKGHPEAQARVGGFYALGHGVDVDYEKAAFWFEKAAKQGSASALNDLGNMHSLGLYFEKNEAHAVGLYQISAELGNPGGQYSYGQYLLKSDDPKIVADGLLLLSKAADSGFEKAQTTLALHYIEGNVVPTIQCGCGF